MRNGYRLTAATGIHKGDRDYQQDRVELLSHPRANGCVLGIVADGMGGRSGGRKASDQVIMTARQLFDRYAPATDDAAAMLMQVAREAHVVIKLTAIAVDFEESLEKPAGRIVLTYSIRYFTTAGAPGTVL